MVIWFTGISGTGKTTLGKKFLNFFKKKHPKSIYFDGDSFRSLFDNDLKYSLSDRNKNAFRLTRLTKYLNEQKYNIIVTANLTSNKYRNWCSPLKVLAFWWEEGVKYWSSFVNG